MSEFFLGSKDVRYLLQNAAKIKRDGRCIECNGTGFTNWNEDGEDIKFGETDDINRCSGECEECEGVGFVW